MQSQVSWGHAWCFLLGFSWCDDDDYPSGTISGKQTLLSISCLGHGFIRVIFFFKKVTSTSLGWIHLVEKRAKSQVISQIISLLEINKNLEEALVFRIPYCWSSKEQVVDNEQQGTMRLKKGTNHSRVWSKLPERSVGSCGADQKRLQSIQDKGDFR